jgi:2'-5' RNA ligase
MEDFLAVVAYPRLEHKDSQWIENYRQENDVYYDLINAHYTLVFPVSEFEINEFIQEIKKQASGIARILFEVKCAIRNNDLTSDLWHVLLVPDKGFSQVVRLHDKLYSGKLKNLERLDLDFIPHIGIANSKEPLECKSMVDEINNMNIQINGEINQLDIITHKSNIISTIDTINLF